MRSVLRVWTLLPVSCALWSVVCSVLSVVFSLRCAACGPWSVARCVPAVFSCLLCAAVFSCLLFAVGWLSAGGLVWPLRLIMETFRGLVPLFPLDLT